MGDETVPFLGGEVGVARGESNARMVFECADYTFGGTAEVYIWGGKLEVDFVLVKGFLHGTVAFIV